MMKKIVELIVKMSDDTEFEDVGVDAVALVENPAIELPFLAFKAEEAFVEPQAGESEEDFVGRCIPAMLDEGYDQDQAVAICYSMYEGKQDAEFRQHFEDKVLEYAAKHGMEYDPLNVVYVDTTKDRFSVMTDWLDGIKALGLLTNRQASEEGKQMYRYAGPKAQRPFCRALQSNNKLFTRDQIFAMEAAAMNSAMGHKQRPYSIWSWQGGPNCKHYWEEVRVFTGADGKLIFLSKGPAEGNAGQSNRQLPLNGYVNETTKKNSEVAYAISQKKMGFSVIDEEKRIVVGPVLIPNKLIRRLDEKNQEYFVFFSEKTIQDISEMLFKRNLQNQTNVEHNSNATDATNTLLESWLVVDPAMDKATAMGFEVPKGTLMQSRRINDDKTWQDVKDGKLRGFSVEGVFLERATESKGLTDDQLFDKIVDILNQIK